MITFSGFRPVMSTALSPRSHAEAWPRFGFWWGGDSYMYSSMDLDPRDNYWAGYVPSETVKSVLGPDSGLHARVIDSKAHLETLWRTLGQPDYDLPDVDFKKRSVVFVAVNRELGTEAIPSSLRYNRRFDDMTITVPPESSGSRYPGMAWYLGVVANGAEEKNKASDLHLLSAKTRVSAR